MFVAREAGTQTWPCMFHDGWSLSQSASQVISVRAGESWLASGPPIHTIHLQPNLLTPAHSIQPAAWLPIYNYNNYYLGNITTNIHQSGLAGKQDYIHKWKWNSMETDASFPIHGCLIHWIITIWVIEDIDDTSAGLWLVWVCCIGTGTCSGDHSVYGLDI